MIRFFWRSRSAWWLAARRVQVRSDQWAVAQVDRLSQAALLPAAGRKPWTSSGKDETLFLRFSAFSKVERKLGWYFNDSGLHPHKTLADGRIEISHCFKWIFAGIATLQGPVVRMTLYFPPTPVEPFFMTIRHFQLFYQCHIKKILLKTSCHNNH